jgi:hypothetical protein
MRKKGPFRGLLVGAISAAALVLSTFPGAAAPIDWWSNFRRDFHVRDEYRVNDISLHHHDSNRVYISSRSGRSSLLMADYNNGVLQPLLPFTESVAVDPQNSEHLVALALADGTIQSKTLVESIDGGLTWSVLVRPVPDLNLKHIEYAPGTSGILYLLQHDGGSRGSGTGLHVSRDGGRSWQIAQGTPRGSGVGPIAISPTDPNRAFLISSGYVLRSDDGGSSWSQLLIMPGAGAVEVDSFNSNKVYVSDSASGLVYMSDDAGNTWRVSVSVADFIAERAEIWSIESNQFAPDLLYVAANASSSAGRAAVVIRSVDGGLSWVRINDDANTGLPTGKGQLNGEYIAGGITRLASGQLGSCGDVSLYASVNDPYGLYRYVDYPFGRQCRRGAP